MNWWQTSGTSRLPIPAIIEAELRAWIHDNVVLILKGDPREYQTRLENVFAEAAIMGHDLGLDDALLVIGDNHSDPRIQEFVALLRPEVRALRFRP